MRQAARFQGVFTCLLSVIGTNRLSSKLSEIPEHGAGKQVAWASRRSRP
jgi:hypothetical protein